MSLQLLHPPAWLPPIGYANGISVPAGRIVFIAGQVGWDANQHFQSEELVPQFEQALNSRCARGRAGPQDRRACRYRMPLVGKCGSVSRMPARERPNRVAWCQSTDRKVPRTALRSSAAS